MRPHLVRLALALAAVPIALAAQTPGPDPLCWRGRPLARCEAFLLFEFTAPRHLAGTRLDPVVTQNGYGHPRWDQGLASQFVYDVGYMRNVSPNSAVGGTIEMGFIVDDPRTVGVLGATARYRRWLARRTAADGAVGLLRMPVGVLRANPYNGQPERVSVRRPALSGDVRLGFADLLGVNARAMVATDGRGRTHTAVFVGASVGSTVTAAATAAMAAYVGAIYALAPHGEDVVVSPPR